MSATTLQLVREDDLQTFKQDIHEIKEALKQRPDDLFKLRWIESKKVPPLLGISSRTWQSWRDKRMVPFSQFGSKIYVRLSDLDDLLEANKIESL